MRCVVIYDKRRGFTFERIGRYVAGCLHVGKRVRVSLNDLGSDASAKRTAVAYRIRDPVDRDAIRDVAIEAFSKDTTYDLAIVIGDSSIEGKASKQTLHTCRAVVYLGTFLRKRRKTEKDETSGPIIFEGTVGFDVGVRGNVYEMLWYGGSVAVQRLEPHQVSKGGAKFLDALETSRLPVQYRSGVWKTIWGTGVLQTSLQAAAALRPERPLRPLLSRSRAFRRLVARLIAEGEETILANYRDPRGRKQWSVDMSPCFTLVGGSSAVGLILGLPNCCFGALSRVVLFSGFLGSGLRTSSQEDALLFERGGTKERVIVRALSKIATLAESRHVTVPVTVRVLKHLRATSDTTVDNSRDDDDALWNAMLADAPEGAIGRFFRETFESVGSLLLKSIVVCVLAWLVAKALELFGYA